MAFRKKSHRLRLNSKGVIASAEAIRERIAQELPTHSGLAAAAERIVGTARESEQVSRSLRRVFSLHRLPAYFLATALLLLVGGLYWRFIHVSTLTLALPDRDATELREITDAAKRVKFQIIATPGSKESRDKVAAGDVDLAFIQGGIDIPRELPRLETPNPEIVLWMIRGDKSLDEVRKVLTSLRGEGSHSVAKKFFADWGVASQIEYVHLRRDLASDGKFEIADDLDAVFVVKDPASERTHTGLERLYAAGFRLHSPWLGVRAENYPFLRTKILPTGYLSRDHSLPAGEIETYSVATYLVARQGLTPRLLHVAAHIFEGKPLSIIDREFAPNATNTSEIFQGIEAFLSILVYIGVAFLALLGLEMYTYRKRFHELNSLVTVLSMLQSNKDVLGARDLAIRSENMLYLSLCSDLLGLVSAISGYYAQENAALVFNNLSELIHQRCDSLKINIQLKILHATIDFQEAISVGASDQEETADTDQPAEENGNAPVNLADSGVELD